MIDFPLRTSPRHRESNRIAYLKKCAPFVENKRAVLIHRPTEVTIHHLGRWGRHMGVHYFCGAIQSGKDKFTFLYEVPEGRIVCAVCEERALQQGLPSSSELTGRHVCVGGVKAISFCCGEADHE